jgi:hypothetical protein
MEMKSDHTFVLKLPDLSISISNNTGSVKTESWVEGSWDVDGTTIKFTPKTVAGKPIEQVLKEMADEAQKDAAQQELARQQEASRQAQLQAQQQQQQTQPDPSGQAATSGGTPAGQPPTTPQTYAPPAPPSSHVNVTKQLVLPQDASLSQDQRKLQIHFKDAVQPPIELEKQ